METWRPLHALNEAETAFLLHHCPPSKTQEIFSRPGETSFAPVKKSAEGYSWTLSVPVLDASMAAPSNPSMTLAGAKKR